MNHALDRKMIKRWNDLWKKFGDTRHAEPVFNTLALAYNEEHRAYHNMDHIRHCLEEIDGVRDKLDRPDAVELAIWFHDVVYDTKSECNEEKSAELASAELRKHHIGETVIALVTDLILATKHHQPGECRDTAYLLDADISTLGAPGNRYIVYETSIRKEYDWVPYELYKEKRREVLMSFINRDQIFSTAYFAAKYENQARVNLQTALDAL